MTFKAFLVILSFIGMSLILLLKPQWIIKLTMRPNEPESKKKVIKIIIQAFGVFGLVFAIYAIINTLFFCE
jgi:hypothetical protein